VGDHQTADAVVDVSDRKSATGLQHPKDLGGCEIWRGEVNVWPEWFPRRDAELASEIDRFPFALPVRREDGLLIARAVFP